MVLLWTFMTETDAAAAWCESMPYQWKPTNSHKHDPLPVRQAAQRQYYMMVGFYARRWC